jgi:hypothetical protein
MSRSRIPRPLSLLAALACASLSCAASAEECGWLPTEQVDAAFPQYAPWGVMVGGAAGSCKFASDPTRPANVFGANQMVKASPAEAEQFVASLRGSMAKSYVVAPYPQLGKAAFTYRPKPGSGLEDRTIYFVAHDAQVAVIASLLLQEPITPAATEAGAGLVRAALAIGGDPAALAAAGDCPWFDTALLKQLLPGKGFSAQAFGSNSCMAQADGQAVIVSIRAAADAGLARGGDGCTTVPAVALGAQGSLSYDCKGGRPHAKVGMLAGAHFVEYSYAPGREPTETERALLVTLAAKAQAAAR